ncbi:MAG: riboflavin synthase [Bacteroidota bacterium]
MFTGIVSHIGEIYSVSSEGSGKVIEIFSPFEEVIKIDQSIAHDGVCLTVADILKSTDTGSQYKVVAVEETLKKTNVGSWQAGDRVNLEMCLKVGDRLDGHFVQGHVDTVGRVEEIEDREGSWLYKISYPKSYAHLLVEKGSICVNGTSLTVIDAGKDYFTLTIIPYTYEHTSFQYLKEGDPVNLEFDILGKYFLRKQWLESVG